MTVMGNLVNICFPPTLKTPWAVSPLKIAVYLFSCQRLSNNNREWHEKRWSDTRYTERFSNLESI